MKVLVRLSDEQFEFVRAQIDRKTFGDVESVLRAGLERLMQMRQEDDDLREMIAAGDASIAAGRVREYRPGDVLAHFQGVSRSAAE